VSLTVTEPVETSPAERPGLWSAAGAWRGVGIALGIFALTRLGQLIMLVWLGDAANDGESLRQRLLIWDGGWFLRVAMDGYPHGYSYDAAGHLAGNELAFFPVYPMLIRLVAALGANPGTAAITVSWIASAGCGGRPACSGWAPR
jgi:hypothetical protein